MKIYLAAAPHTFLRHKDGKRFADFIFGVNKDERAENEKMQILLAGGVSGNLKPAWSRMEDNSPEAFMKALKAEKFWVDGFEEEIINHRPLILESFYYVDQDVERLLPYFGDFLLDSGAFTFMENSKVRVDWDEYTEKYADFINRNDIKKFFELDIDSIVGYEKVLKIRERLERLTGKKSIPVWHSPRGKDEFIKHCKEYPLVALGGIVGKEWKESGEKFMPWFIREAHRNGAKIHGLGYTKMAKLEKFHFDSVDSTAWTAGNKFGFIYHFDGKTMQKIKVPQGKKLADPRKVAFVNYFEWIKFQRYAEVCL